MIGTGRSCNVDWSKLNQLFRDGDVVGAFALVLERGELEDLVQVMELLGPRPDVSMDDMFCFSFSSLISVSLFGHV